MGALRDFLMIYRHTKPGRLLLHTVLIAGAVLFSLPFLWMVGTSMMSDREMFRPGMHFLPNAPQPRAQSPYLSDQEYPVTPQCPRIYPYPLWKEHRARVLGYFRERIEVMKIDNPDGFDQDALVTAIFTGVWQKSLEISDPKVWIGMVDKAETLASTLVTPEMVKEVLEKLRRRLCLGHVSIRTAQFQHRELAAGAAPADLWKPESGDIRLQPILDDSRALRWFTTTSTGIGSGRLSAAMDSPVPADQVRTLTIAMRQDETWHHYSVTVESAGRKWQSDEPLYLGGTQWQEVLLKKWDPDNYSIYESHPWTWLQEQAGGSRFNEGHRVRVTLTATRATPLEAWYGKALYNYRLSWKYVPMWRYAATSFALVALNIVLMVLSSSLAAYAFARLQWPGRDFLFLVLLGTLMIPHQVTLIPGFIIMKSLGWYNTLQPMWIHAAFGSAFNIFLLRQFMKGIPTDLEDAARIDGCGFLRIWWHIMLPLVKPTLAAIAVFTFIGTWNDFMTPLIYLNDQRLYPLSLGLFQLQTILGTNYAMMMAASIIMTLPVIAVFFLAQKYFVQGITLTGMKA